VAPRGPSDARKSISPLADADNALDWMRALAAQIEKGSFEVDAQNARDAGFQGFANRCDRSRHRLTPIADQRRQKSSRAEPSMRLGHGAQTRERRLVVEENAATTVDLNIDESGRQQASWTKVERFADEVGRRAEFPNQPILDDDDRSFPHPLAVEHPFGADRMRRLAHQSVSVTFVRLGGESGSKPRARASRSMA
jgi:hypothetical protein